MSEKTEKATPYKLQKAKEKGQVNRSMELTSCISLFVVLSIMGALGRQQLHELQALMRHLLQMAGHLQWNLDSIHNLHTLILTQITNLWLPFAFSAGLSVILINIAQTGLVWSITPLIPDFKRLHWMQGFKKLCSLKTCFDAAKSSLKLSASFLFLFFTLKHQLQEVLPLMLASPQQQVPILIHFLLKLALQLLTLLCGFAVLDYLYSRWKFAKDQRMSKQDIKDEYKQKEGDPKIKTKIRQLQQELRKKTASLKQVQEADVIITNPTHIAIALKYDRHTMPAPKVICKAQDKMVIQVKELARKAHIPIVEHKTLARMLYATTEVGQWINKELYPLAARIFRDIYARQQEQR